MTPDEHLTEPVTSQESFVTGVLEPDQLTKADKRPVPRKYLRGPQLLVVWLLRIYLLFMTAVVVYQIWAGMR